MDKKNIRVKMEDKDELITELAEADQMLSEEDVALLTKDDVSRQTYKNLLEFKTALKLEFAADVPDAKAEWQHFQKRIDLPEKKKRKPTTLFIWGAIAGIAASLLFIFLYSWTMKQPAFTDSSYTTSRQENLSQARTTVNNHQSGNSPVNTRQPKQPALSLNPSYTASKLNATSAIIPAATSTLSATNTLKEQAIKEHTVEIPHGKDLKVELSDGTIVWLNAASRITYPEYFTGNERVVTLEGEAYFQVKHDPAHPFIIHTRNISARVLGTELNVSSYANAIPHITLIKGRVEVGSATTGSIILQPGQDARLTGNGNIEVKNVDTAKYIYWKEGYLYFDNEPLADAMRAIGNWYDVQVVFEKKRLSTLRVHMFCNRHRPVEEALDNLNKIYNLQADYRNNTIFIK